MIAKLSPTKKKIYDLYKKHLQNNQSLTYQKASELLKIQVSAIFKHVSDLVKKGYLQKLSDGSIALFKTPATTTELEKVKIPLLGVIACGKPIHVFEEYEALEVPTTLVKGGGSFYALQAEGESMANERAGILSGDYLIIRQQSDVADGDIGVLIEKDDFNEYATLKQIFHTKSGILAKPKNPRFDSFVIANKNAEIRGKLMGVIREYDI